MGHPLDGCWSKVERANVHLELLGERMESLIVNHDTFGIDTKDDSQTGEVIVYGEAYVAPPSDEWGAIIGDVVHNLRSALDHLVWQLTIANGNTPPTIIPRGKPGRKWRNLRFPIYTFDPMVKPEHRHPSSGRRMGWRLRWPGWEPGNVAGSLWGVRPALRAEFYRLQPFYRRKKPQRHPLALLDELWNIDKHRHLHLPTFFVWMVGVNSVKPFFLMPERNLSLVKAYGPKPFKGRTEIGRVGHVGDYRDPMLKMYVQPDIAYEVAFEKGPPAYGAGVTQTLKGIHDTVAAILVKFDSEFL